MAYCLHELAKNPTLQKRAHHEIDEVLKKYNGNITYDSMMDLKFLESCIDGKILKVPKQTIKIVFCTL